MRWACGWHCLQVLHSKERIIIFSNVVYRFSFIILPLKENRVQKNSSSGYSNCYKKLLWRPRFLRPPSWSPLCTIFPSHANTLWYVITWKISSIIKWLAGFTVQMLANFMTQWHTCGGGNDDNSAFDSDKFPTVFTKLALDGKGIENRPMQ